MLTKTTLFVTGFPTIVVVVIMHSHACTEIVCSNVFVKVSSEYLYLVSYSALITDTFMTTVCLDGTL